MMLISTIPRYSLYGEPVRAADDRFVHLEDLDDRTRPAAWRIQPHTHADLHQIFQIVQGGGIVTVEGEPIVFVAPCALIIPVGMVHSINYEPGSAGRVLTLSDACLRLLVCEECVFASLFDSAQAIGLSENRRFDLLLDGIHCEHAGSSPGRHIALRAYLTLLLVEISRLMEGRIPDASPRLSSHACVVAQFRSIIEDNYRKGWLFEKYCDELGVPARQLRTACRVILDSTPGQVIAERIIREAKRLMFYSDMSVSKAAYELGFQDPAYFSRYFSRATGLAPSAFRNMSKADH